MRKPLVAGNWKMNGTRQTIATLVEGLKAGIDTVNAADVAVCVPYVYLGEVGKMLEGTRIALGAQNVSDKQEGAYTGEVSASMLADFGTRYVIIGHSERRALYGRDDAFVARKYARALEHGITPIFCVGELLEEREEGITQKVVGRQIEALLELEGVDALRKGVVAYEPVWAIGTGKTASPEQAQEVHKFIRDLIAEEDAEVAEGLQILYGGSMKPSNASDLLSMPDVDGGLIGGASLNAEEFLAICRAANK